MNTANPHQTIRKEDRRDQSDKTARHTELHVVTKKEKMPSLNQGSKQGAQAVIADYRQEAVDQMIALRDMIGEVVRSPLNTATDDDLSRAALCCEITVEAIHKYLRVVEAGQGWEESIC